MPLFFFHVRGGTLEVEDEEGVDLPDLAAVREEAVLGARSIIAAEVLNGRLPLSERIDVENGDGQPVLTLPFSEAVATDG